MTKFKIGDRVTVSGQGLGWDKESGAVVGIKLDEGGTWPFRVKFDNGFYGLYDGSELVAEVPAKPKFKFGDWVKVAPHGFKYGAFGGKVLIVNGPSTDEGFDYQVRALGHPYTPGHDFREDELEPHMPPAVLAKPVAPVFAKGGKIEKAEAVEHPAHYGGDTPYEVIKVAEAWGFNENAYLFNALKYLARAGKKGSKVEDLKKLVFYVEREIGLEEAK